MLDLSLFALGAALVGLGASLLLAGFGLVDRDSGLSTGSGLVTALVLVVIGTFSMGIAAEGPARRTLASVRSEIERSVSRALASVAVGIVLVVAASSLRRYAVDFPPPLTTGVDLIRATGVAGLWPVPVIGVPLAWGVRQAALFGKYGLEAELPILFTVWVIALIALR
ncbi:MAG: hypothetical protein ACT4OP_09885 [Actinomycetota bacterium]